MSDTPHAGERREIHLVDSGRTDAILEAVRAALEARRDAIELDPSISTVTLLVHLDRGPEPRVIYRTESRTGR